MAFQEYLGGRTQGIHPFISISPQGVLTFSKAAMARWFQDAFGVKLYCDEKNRMIAIKPFQENDWGVLEIRNMARYNPNHTPRYIIQVLGFLRAYRFPIPEKTVRFAPKWNDKKKWIEFKYWPKKIKKRQKKKLGSELELWLREIIAV